MGRGPEKSRDSTVDNSAVATTRVPIRMQEYFKRIAPDPAWRTLQNMHIAMLDEFLLRQPWRSIGWRETQALSKRWKSDDSAGASATGWLQVNIRVSADMLRKITAVCESEGVSRSSFLYTAMLWWMWFEHPPSQELEWRKDNRVNFKT